MRVNQLPIINYQLPITNYQLPITDYQLPILNYQLPNRIFYASKKSSMRSPGSHYFDE
ncbi:MAG: hypothetical protein HC942_03195 [Microcoleus sp. SU_5_6]|nr:hypothetical protein [Microcoleus sp. SU_5_6]NJL69091.1 hypothetical protein [Microcoleus sp. SM1_3_4]